MRKSMKPEVPLAQEPVMPTDAKEHITDDSP